MIEVTNLTKEFAAFRAVNNISFSVEEGETLIVIGTSGCGKTTTIKMLNRLIEPTSGKITIGGKDIEDENPESLRRKIGYVIQNIGLFPHYTVEQNVGIVPELLKWDRSKTIKRTNELLELLGLSPSDFLNRYPHELSGGQRQRIGIARALAADPPVVILDEPFGALDQITRREIQKEFKNLESLLNKTMIMVTHDIFEAFELCDKVCLMHEGNIQQLATPKELIFSPKNQFVSSFFETNRFQLELQVLKLKDILNEISTKEITTRKVKEFNTKDSLLDVFEQMEQAAPKETMQESMLRIKDSAGKAVVETTTEAVMSAFYKIKSKLQK